MRIYIFFLAIGLPICAMDLVQRETEQEKSERYDRVARYFVKHLPNMKMKKAFEVFAQLDWPVRQMICDGSVAKKSPFIALFAVPQDIFTHVVQCALPYYSRIRK